MRLGERSRGMTKEDDTVDEIDLVLSSFLYDGKMIEPGPFKNCVFYIRREWASNVKVYYFL